MYQAVDSNGIGYVPERNANRWWILYFLFFIIIFNFFLLNLFVGVVVSTFNTEKERLGKNFLLTDTQKEWLRMKMMLLNTKPVIKKIVNTSFKIRIVCFKIANSRAFEGVILGCIILNTIVLTLDWYQMPKSVENIETILNYFFTVIFSVEVIIKVIAFQRAYFRSNWNRFDFLIVLASLVGIILDQTTELSLGGKATIVRAFRVVRLFRIIKKAKVLKIIIDTLIVTLPHLANVGGLLLLILYIYTILGI
jgi:hypothetical protein